MIIIEFMVVTSEALAAGRLSVQWKPEWTRTLNSAHAVTQITFHSYNQTLLVTEYCLPAEIHQINKDDNVFGFWGMLANDRVRTHSRFCIISNVQWKMTFIISSHLHQQHKYAWSTIHNNGDYHHQIWYTRRWCSYTFTKLVPVTCGQ